MERWDVNSNKIKTWVSSHLFQQQILVYSHIIKISKFVYCQINFIDRDKTDIF